MADDKICERECVKGWSGGWGRRKLKDAWDFMVVLFSFFLRNVEVSMFLEAFSNFLKEEVCRSNCGSIVYLLDEIR